MKKRILIVDDDKSICFAFKKTFDSNEFEVIDKNSGTEALNFLKIDSVDVIFMDITMPDIGGLDVTKKIREENILTPIIIITGMGDLNTAVQAMKLGAFDYLTKPLDIEKLRITARRAIEMKEMENKIKNLEHKLKASEETNKTAIIGNHPLMSEIFKKIGMISSLPNSSNILILGETGTGKELVAKSIHENSENSEKPFKAINCTVLPENLLESELFGHEKGAFTGAESRKIGKFEHAGEGTIFLDEIGDMPPKLQKKLLRVIQERNFERLGGNDIIPLKARIIAATHKKLKEEVRLGNFREDLFFRLNVFEIILPSLKDRKSDIPLLVNYFISKYNKRFKKDIRSISNGALNKLFDYNFPGNIRELENTIERAVAMEPGLEIQEHSIFLEKPSSLKEDIFFFAENIDFNSAKKALTEKFEKEYIGKKLKDTFGNVTEAAKLSGIERQSFQRLMRKYDILNTDFK
ncbi:MAG: sigma-54 dependent transcriptional regulator [Bacteroidetes bacterium]|nr:sigma-54 dependent transcriptional regulator [Bacteroidota bacterium]MBU1681006.1 sigma-54 dependent transcriptional regulator [Bacteroidota bacterium]MBU2507030.1 sigma-54 dependent transcriptional regulator [Bacteroidota bacterium]